MAFDNKHDQPGRRFAKGATKDDILLGSFGLFSHIVLFLCLGAGVAIKWPDSAETFIAITGALAAICLIVRGIQVRSTTTKESIAAIIEAFRD